MLFSPLITALMLTLSVIPCPAMAKSVKIPTDYRGIWCTTTDVAYKRCRKADSDAIEINAHHFFPNMDEKCVPLAIVPKGDSFLVQADCEWIRAPRRIVERECYRWLLTNGGRQLLVATCQTPLREIIAAEAYKDKPALPEAYRGEWCAARSDSEVSYWIKDPGYPDHDKVCHGDPDARWSFSRNSFGGHETGCRYISVKKASRGVQIVGRCQSGTDPRSYLEHLNLSLSGDRLTITVTKSTQ